MEKSTKKAAREVAADGRQMKVSCRKEVAGGVGV